MRWRQGWVALAVPLALAACSKSESKPASHGKPFMANAYASGHSLAEGQELYLHETWGLEQLDAWPPTEFMLELTKSEPDVFGNQFEKFGFIPDPSDDLPVGLKRGSVDPSRVYGTCGLCHVGKLDDGRVWIGAPNWRLELGRFQIEVDKRWVAAGHASQHDAASLAKAAALGPGRIGAEAEGALIPDDIPVAYNLSERKFLSKVGTGHDLRSEVYLSLFGFGAGYPNEKEAKVKFPDKEKLAKFIDAFGSYSPPSAPKQDGSRVAAGKALFESAKCSSCHKVGDLGAEGVTFADTAPDGLDRLPGADPKFPKGSVHTDPLMIWQVTDGGPPDSDAGTADAGSPDGGDAGLGFDPSLGYYIAFILGNALAVSSSDGYRIPDLRALWASPPYLHNGSVPTLEDLLSPAAKRPAKWSPVSGFSLDTSLPGNGNFGHEFGTELTDAEKLDLVAYMKSL